MSTKDNAPAPAKSGSKEPDHQPKSGRGDYATAYKRVVKEVNRLTDAEIDRDLARASFTR